MLAGDLTSEIRVCNVNFDTLGLAPCGYNTTLDAEANRTKLEVVFSVKDSKGATASVTRTIELLPTCKSGGEPGAPVTTQLLCTLLPSPLTQPRTAARLQHFPHLPICSSDSNGLLCVQKRCARTTAASRCATTRGLRPRSTSRR